jgi:hypothetical protein
MEGGSVEAFRLGNIGNFAEVDDFYPISIASIFGLNLAIAGARIGNLGGASLNTYFEAFGLEGILANVALIILILQISRFAYTRGYGLTKPWSPFVFVCILLGVQFIHDLIFYYGAINVLPSGKNEMIDALKEYAREHGGSALGGHALLLIVTAVAAMIFKETTALVRMTMVALFLYMTPYIITMVKPRAPVKPPPAPPAPRSAEPRSAETPLNDKLTARDMYQDMNWGLR